MRRIGLILWFSFSVPLAIASPTARGPVGATTAAAADEVDETIQVTATRLPEDVLNVPAAVTVISGEELRARGVTDLAGALALAGGVSVAPGGDGGPASSVPELMGLREFDAFLLVVDDVPWGGAFNPALSTLDLTDVDRIELLRGAAPVLFGATSFVGVIHVIHRDPVRTPREAGASGGSYGSFGAALTSALPGGPSLSSSISASFDRRGFEDDRTGYDRAHLRWSGRRETAGGELRLAADVTDLRQDPASPHPREGASLSSLVPLDANHNPSDGKIDETRYQVTVGYDHAMGAARWTSTLALTHTDSDTVRGSLRETFDVPPPTANADGYRQEFSGDDLYLDTHGSWSRGADLSVVAGVDLLAGKGRAESENFEYHVALDGSGAPSSGSLPIDERPQLDDERLFGGLYSLVLWSPTQRWKIDAGARLNRTREKQEGEVEEGDMDVTAEDSRTDTRLAGSLGASFRAWRGGSGSVWVFAGYTDAFKPAAVDFGPEAEGEILDPETARTVQAGVKGSHGGGRVFWQAMAFRMDFDNLVVSQTVDGLPSLANAGSERFDGLELEGRWRVLDSLHVEASAALHAAEFRDYVAEFDGTPTQLSGNRLELSADRLASLGVRWFPERGVLAWGTVNYVGERYLDKRNTALADPYTTASAGVGYRFARADLRLEGVNLADVRDAVSESELGDAQYYRLPSRSLRASVLYRW